jgi:inosine-uridine nucleoside N-ribohydrolase
MPGRALNACLLAVALVAAACGTRSTPTGTDVGSNPPAEGSSSTQLTSPAPAASSRVTTPSSRTILVDTDVAPDDLVALTFLLKSANVTIAAITVAGTGEAHCAGGVDVVLRLLDRLDAPEIPVACGRETPLAGDHAFPDAWRGGADAGSGLALPATTRTPSSESAVALIRRAATSPGLEILTLGPLTNLADAFGADPSLGPSLGPVVVMGGAVHVPGNLVGPGAPTGNAVAEWNVYIDGRAAQVVVDSHLDLLFVSLDGTSQVPVTTDFVGRVRSGATGPGARVLTDLLDANPFMTDGSYYLWDPLAAMLAAGHQLGTFSPETIAVEQAEGAESGFTRPTAGPSNCRYLSSVDPTAAENTLLGVLNGP